MRSRTLEQTDWPTQSTSLNGQCGVLTWSQYQLLTMAPPRARAGRKAAGGTITPQAPLQGLNLEVPPKYLPKYPRSTRRREQSTAQVAPGRPPSSGGPMLRCVGGRAPSCTVDKGTTSVSLSSWDLAGLGTIRDLFLRAKEEETQLKLRATRFLFTSLCAIAPLRFPRAPQEPQGATNCWPQGNRAGMDGGLDGACDARFERGNCWR